jgi:hypothetical protein
VTVADREADIYELFALTAELTGDWVIRARHDRARADGDGSMERTVADTPVLATEEVEVARTPNRPHRTAKLEVRATEVRVAPPTEREQAAKARWFAVHPGVERVGPSLVGALTLGVIQVTEPHPPQGETAVHWLLVTSLPVAAAADALASLHYYRLRWLVERFHFVLKSGCRVEKLQLEHGDRLRRALTIYSVVAAWLLQGTYLARTTPDAPATLIMDDEAWRVLLTVHHPHQPLPDQPPTVRQALRLLAQLGGFLARTSDGEPGVVTVWRGFRRLSDMIFAWRIFTSVSMPSLA